MTAFVANYGFDFMTTEQSITKASYSRGTIRGSVLRRLEIFGARVEAEMQRRGWSQQELARQCGKDVSQKTISNIINIRKVGSAPRTDLLMIVADTLGISLVETMMSDDDVENADMVDAIVNHFNEFDEQTREYIKGVIMREYNALKPKRLRRRRI